ncbi:MAG: nitronate monooxygenase [Chloroflexi bacterium]|nr:nitronate monooxygenase [Chloroflexota bacterium]
MFRTRVCDILGIEYPIIQSPMNFPVTPQLVAAVSNAGGLGMVSSSMLVDKELRVNGNPERLRDHTRAMIREVRKLTSKPFGINLGIKGSQDRMRQLWKGEPVELPIDAVTEVAIEEKVPIAYVSIGGPELLTEKLHKAGMKVMHIGTSVRHARKAEEAGVDIFVCAGYEAGGHSPGKSETPLFVLLPQVADAIRTPIVAGCGIADARGLVAAFALGAEGIAMGTRFLATSESRLHPKAKQAIVDADDTATAAWGKKLGVGLARSLKNRFTQKYLDMELAGAGGRELMEFVEETYQDPTGRGLGRRASAYFNADLEWGEMYLGAVAGLIREIKGAGEVVGDIVTQVDGVMGRLNTSPLSSRL